MARAPKSQEWILEIDLDQTGVTPNWVAVCEGFENITPTLDAPEDERKTYCKPSGTTFYATPMREIVATGHRILEDEFQDFIFDVDYVFSSSRGVFNYRYYNVVTNEGETGEMTINPTQDNGCLLYTSPSPRDRTRSRMPSSA